ncbi:hypothetical protein [Plantactinospora sp. KBS50]|uniref:hypothetical protein n=1 Tax=Plantactinospora sp. KBS50 TaxID=2024580 RepID=UPI001E48507F|nr:hypothetical protein [Plantactinospora sp. KBS50]
MKAHRTDQVSLIFAILFLAIAGWWLVAQLLDLVVPALGWFVAGGLILLGMLGLVGALRSGGTPAAAPEGAAGAAPSSAAPSSAAPTSAAPTSAAPTSASPTSGAPGAYPGDYTGRPAPADGDDPA